VIPAQLHRVDNLIFRQLNEFSRANGVEDITAMHGWILSFLYENQGKAIFQRDVEQSFDITRSTVTNILQLMEKKGYIRREGVPEDARLKRLILTPAGAAAQEKIVQSLRQTTNYIDGLLSAEEHTELMRLLEKLKAGLTAGTAAQKQGRENLHDPNTGSTNQTI
jgi:DNA-binding MarR family transcriptional regulator